MTVMDIMDAMEALSDEMLEVITNRNWNEQNMLMVIMVAVSKRKTRKSRELLSKLKKRIGYPEIGNATPPVIRTKNETTTNTEQGDVRSKSINKTKKESKSNKIKVADMLELLAGNKPTPLTNFEIPKDLVGLSYESLFAKKLEGSKSLTLVDTYIRNNRQLENLDEFLSMYRKITPKIEQCEVHLLTKSPKDNQTVKRKHEVHLQQIKKKFADRGLKFAFEFNDDIHARSIKADNGCKISLDLGLDIFQKSEYINGKGYLKPQKERLCKKFELVFLRW